MWWVEEKERWRGLYIRKGIKEDGGHVLPVIVVLVRTSDTPESGSVETLIF